jgi:hypothetical protein
MNSEHGTRALRALARVDPPSACAMMVLSYPDAPDGTRRACGQAALQVDFDRNGGYVLRIEVGEADRSLSSLRSAVCSNRRGRRRGPDGTQRPAGTLIKQARRFRRA